jgi:hypothetical protein
MTEVLVEFDTVTTGPDGIRWAPRACGRPADDGLWEGWIEFTPIDADAAIEPVRTGRETEQPNRADLMYWAQGLTQVYLDDALLRAIEVPGPVRQLSTVHSSPYFDGPAQRVHASAGRPLLNPFSVYQQGEDVLLRQLSALDTPRVRDIAVGYGFTSGRAGAAARREQLIATIVMGVRAPSAAAPSSAQARDAVIPKRR